MTYRPPLFKQFFHNARRLIAKNWLSRQKALQIAVTGSQGKTNTTQMLAEVLSAVSPTTATDSDLDTVYNVPITALKVFPWTKFAVFELGVDYPGEMDLHLQIVKPKIAIITGISPVHTDREHLGSLETLIKEKRKLIEALPKDGWAVLNWDDENVRKMASYTKAKILWYGTDKNHCDIWTDNIQVSLDGTSFDIHSVVNRHACSLHIKTKLIGRHHIYTIMPAFLVCQIIAKNPPRKASPCEASFSQLSPLPGRMSVEEGPMETIILNDSLRANPASTVSGLQTLSEIDYKNGRKIAVLAEMGELQHPKEEHQKIINLIFSLNIDYVITIGHLFPQLPQPPQSPQIYRSKNVIEAADILKKIIKNDDLIYLKGSLLKHAERVLLILKGKKVGCNVISCPFYWHCQDCQYLEVGYQNKETNVYVEIC